MATLIALVAMLLYMAISLRVGDRFPFSKYSMYADLRTRDEGAVLYVRLGERFVDPDQLEAVHGLDVEALDPKKRPCSQQWLVYEAQRWLRDHTVASVPDGGELVEVGWRLLRIEPDGSLSERLEPMTRGTGRPFA